MSCSQLSEIRQQLSKEQYSAVETYLSSLSPNAKITLSAFITATRLDLPASQAVLDALVDSKTLRRSYGIRCPNCGILLAASDSVSDLPKECNCYHCSEEAELTPEDIDVLYTFAAVPFAAGQQIEQNEQAVTVARECDTLAHLLKNGKLDLNAEFFSPSEDDYSRLQNLYKQVFKKQKNTKETGDTLEKLSAELFNLCKHFRAAPIRTATNQIDCFVRNTLFVPGIIRVEAIDSFIIECKNESTAPTVGYMNKLHSVMTITGQKLGIIISRHKKPPTFDDLAMKLYLREDIIILSLDADDLHSIIFDRANLLECMERKITSIKSDATIDLVAAGLYDA